MDQFDRNVSESVVTRKNLKGMVEQGLVPLGLYVSIPSPFIAEYAAIAGFDYIMLDLEHHLFNLESIANIIRAADAYGIATTARMDQLNIIPSLLDFGMVGFKIPHIHNANEVERLVKLIKYAPVGRRGYCAGGRALRFGTVPFMQYYQQASNETFLMVMIEDREGIDNMDEILAVPGIDYVAAGPGDLAQTLGHISEINHPEVLEVIDRIHKVADKYNVKYPGNGAPVNVTDDKTAIVKSLCKEVESAKQHI